MKYKTEGHETTSKKGGVNLNFSMPYRKVNPPSQSDSFARLFQELKPGWWGEPSTAAYVSPGVELQDEDDKYIIKADNPQLIRAAS